MMAKDWRELFTVEQVEKPYTGLPLAGECNVNCQLAKELKCTCKCGGRNHGAALKQHVKSLDEFGMKEMQAEYERHMNAIDWPSVLLQAPHETDGFGPDVEPCKKRAEQPLRVQ